MNLTFDADKYASGAVSINFQGIVKNQDTVSYISIVLNDGDNEISDLEADALQRRSDYGQLMNDGVFSEDKDTNNEGVLSEFRKGVFSEDEKEKVAAKTPSITKVKTV